MIVPENQVKLTTRLSRGRPTVIQDPEPELIDHNNSRGVVAPPGSRPSIYNLVSVSDRCVFQR